MKKHIFAYLLLLGLFLSSFAQTQQDRAAEAKGAEMLKQASEKLKSYRSFKIQFSYEMVQGDRVVDLLKGELISQGDKYRMELGGNLFISDGINAWSYIEEMEEVYINFLEDTEGGLTPTSLLNDFDSQFRAKYIKKEIYNGKNVDIIDLIPKTPQAFYKFRVALDASSKMLIYTNAYDREGGSYTYRIDRMEATPSIDSGTFNFNNSQFPGVEVIDLR